MRWYAKLLDCDYIQIMSFCTHPCLARSPLRKKYTNLIGQFFCFEKSGNFDWLLPWWVSRPNAKLCWALLLLLLLLILDFVCYHYCCIVFVVASAAVVLLLLLSLLRYCIAVLCVVVGLFIASLCRMCVFLGLLLYLLLHSIFLHDFAVTVVIVFSICFSSFLSLLFFAFCACFCRVFFTYSCVFIYLFFTA